ncbi:DUF1453 domain-containing protein [Pseudoxanthomonas putridarboris]|uniref:DUF1453 domain-containing protein n=1 Tax=Pseudoxanthomonas putridarboris TaxID=752605 RepID=A0ABU9J2B5_9GAMM
MPFLLLLLLLLLPLLWVVLLPLSLWQRYRYGRARRLARGWVLAINAWGLLLSVAIFLAATAVSLVWWPDSLFHAALGLAVGALLGIVGVWLTRWEVAPQGVFYQPNAWLVLALLVVVAARIALGFFQLARYWQADAVVQAATLWSGHGGLVAVAGLLLGYYLAYAWGVKWRVARLSRLMGRT